MMRKQSEKPPSDPGIFRPGKPRYFNRSVCLGFDFTSHNKLVEPMFAPLTVPGKDALGMSGDYCSVRSKDTYCSLFTLKYVQ